MLIFFLQIQGVDWPYEDTGEKKNGGEQRTIADYLADNMFDLVINLPLRVSGSQRASSFVTQGYKTRRMAVDYSVPLITDVKCTKLMIEVGLYKEFCFRKMIFFSMCTVNTANNGFNSNWGGKRAACNRWKIKFKIQNGIGVILYHMSCFAIKINTAHTILKINK